MSSQISNTTSISFEYGSEKSAHTISDTTATAVMSESIDISLTSLEKKYYLDEYITYLIAIKNNGIKTSPITLKSNLGTYKKILNDKNTNVTPLGYSGISYLYINGILKNQITPDAKADEIIFSLPAMNEKSNFLLIYKTKVNRFAPLSLKSKIQTTVSLEFSESQNFLETSHAIEVAEKADLKICKNIVPPIFSQGESISYNIAIYNYGNAAAENIKITDNFEPSPTLTNITVNEKEISPSDYSYLNGTFNLPTYSSDLNISVPCANFKTDSTSGAISVQPSVTNIAVCGIL